MRDIAIVLFIFGMIPVMIKKPWVGILMCLWISVMSPHRFSWGFASSLPMSAIAVTATLVGMMTAKDRVKLPINSITVILMILPIWFTVTLAFAFHFPDAFERWKSVMKIFVAIFMTASVLRTRRHIELMVGVLVFSVCFFGVKGGIFTIATGGSHKVYGPPDGYIQDNNAIALALVMTIPLAHYLAMQMPKAWMKYAMYGVMALSFVAVLGSHSRGAFLAVSVMGAFLWIKSRQKFLLGILIGVLIPVAITSMPDNWKDRMRTVETYEQDSSALGRLNAWEMAFNVANDRPLVGGGFELYSAETFAKYAPDPHDVHTAHSIYFQMLGEHGYVGLALFLSLIAAGWLNARKVIKLSKKNPEHAWAGDLARAVQVSLIGFAVGGAFVNIGYWELQYYEILAVMLALQIVKAPAPQPKPEPAPAQSRATVAPKARVRA